jgi:signal transduction histidine kinase
MNEPTAVAEQSPGRILTERILVNAPTGDDAALIGEILGTRGFEVVVIRDVASLAVEWEAGAGVVVLASEALNDSECCASLRRLFDAQDSWSDIPVVVLGGGGEDDTPQVMELLGNRVQLLMLERPLGIATFVSAIEAALRSRRRQYEVKRLLDELAASAIRIREVHKEADRTKDEFLATLAHELRSPMTAIRGWVEMLKAGDLDPADAAEALSMIDSSARVQARIVEDLMDVSRIIAGKLMIERARMDLVPLVRSIVATSRAVAASEGIDLTEDISPEPILVSGDEVRLQQVGWNLLSNAIKFTPGGGAVRVTLRREGAFAVLSVRDNGRGIPPELLPHVFERYRQDEPAEKRAHRGLGLGLAIVRHLVEGQGGQVEAFSDGPGKGAEFVVSLPVLEP